MEAVVLPPKSKIDNVGSLRVEETDVPAARLHVDVHVEASLGMNTPRRQGGHVVEPEQGLAPKGPLLQECLHKPGPTGGDFPVNVDEVRVDGE
jgi:hypothetical protein